MKGEIEMYGWRGKIGVLVPSHNTTIEMDFFRMAPEGVSIHASRIFWGENPVSNAHSLNESTKNIERAVKEITPAEVDVIAYGCTSGSFFKGVGWDQEIINKIKNYTDIPVVTASTAMIEALRVLNVKKVCVGTPYPDEINKLLVEFLEKNEFSVVKILGLGQRDVRDHAKVPLHDIYQLGQRCFNPEAQGLFFSCTQLRSIDVIELLEADLNVPVVTANQALFWQSLKLLKIRPKKISFGSLFDQL